MTADQQAPAAGRRSRTRLVVQGVLSLVLVVAIFYYLLKKLDPAQVWAAITDMTWTELATLGLLAIWNLCTYAFVWMAVTPGLEFWRAMVMTQATTAVANTVPGGSAIGIAMTYSMLGSWGYSRSRTTTAVLVSGVWNSFIKLGMPVLALALVLLQGGAGGGRVVAALVGIAGLVTAIVIFAPMLLVALRDVGVSNDEMGWAEVLAVFAFARLVTAIPITPGGAGLVEAALIAGLVGAGGDTSQVAAAVLIYRALTWALPILVGIACYVWWRRQAWTTPTQGTPRPAGAPQ